VCVCIARLFLTIVSGPPSIYGTTPEGSGGCAWVVWWKPWQNLSE